MKAFLKKKEEIQNKLKKQPVKPVSTKTAILLGLNYPGSFYSLKGCINDVENGSKYFNQIGYNVKLLTDNQVSKNYNVVEILNELGSCSSSNLIFHYSGHGTQVRDLNGDEKDGYDEAVYSKDGLTITDDQVNLALSLFPENKKVFLIFDCCHSGTIADLPFVYTEKDGVQTEQVKKPMKAKIIAISGCMDKQTSADVTSQNISYGALSHTLYTILKENGGQLDWRQLYLKLLVEMRKQGYEQYPVLSASDPTLFYQKVEF